MFAYIKKPHWCDVGDDLQKPNGHGFSIAHIDIENGKYLMQYSEAKFVDWLNVPSKNLRLMGS